MIPDLMDYVIIEKYACGNPIWKESVATIAKTQEMLDISLEAAELIIAIAALPPVPGKSKRAAS